MADSTTINLNLNETTEVEFDVNIMNIDGFEVPKVRLCVGDTFTETLFHAKRVPTSKTGWTVDVAALKEMEDKPTEFRIEVIVDGYFFEAAKGDISYDSKPIVEVHSESLPEMITESETEPEEETEQPVVEEEVKPVSGAKKIAESIIHSVLHPAKEKAEDPKEINSAKVKAILQTLNK